MWERIQTTRLGRLTKSKPSSKSEVRPNHIVALISKAPIGSAPADSVGVCLGKDGGWLGSSSDKKEEKRKRKKTTTMARLPILALVLVSALLFLSSPQGYGRRIHVMKHYEAWSSPVPSHKVSSSLSRRQSVIIDSCSWSHIRKIRGWEERRQRWGWRWTTRSREPIQTPGPEQSSAPHRHHLPSASHHQPPRREQRAAAAEKDE
ncbi:hypothetical protein MUK42_04007 [Musa troglodytarum]|uniref:Uncharacterized protein n=1 Tax=Musa troglodytarum TaxID=320322 RepID=A0A9E7GGM3_9LILI|nr:hypothetical protein MUK42_04007 [Musa troglodytarum]